MRIKQGNIAYHILALCIVVVWGTTFVSTKVLLGKGLNPQEIFFYRFLLAYLLMLACYHRKLFAGSVKDEMLLATAGITGGSLYFYTENTALMYTATTNIALILCITPLLTALLLRFFYRDLKSGWNKRFLTGSGLALTGITLVILNGHFVLHLSPKGDLLCLASAFCWAFYTVCIKKLEKKYNNLFITRKVFFYGVLTILPLYLQTLFVQPGTTSNTGGIAQSVHHSVLRERLSLLLDPTVFGNLLFLGIVASLLCFFFWNITLQKINPIRATNYIYFSPVVTATASFLVLGEPITWIMLCGAVLIVWGVWLSGKPSA